MSGFLAVVWCDVAFCVPKLCQHGCVPKWCFELCSKVILLPKPAIFFDLYHPFVANSKAWFTIALPTLSYLGCWEQPSFWVPLCRTWMWLNMAMPPNNGSGLDQSLDGALSVLTNARWVSVTFHDDFLMATGDRLELPELNSILFYSNRIESNWILSSLIKFSCLSSYLTICQSIYPSIHPWICVSIYIPLYNVPFYQPTNLSTYLSIHLSIHLTSIHLAT